MNDRSLHARRFCDLSKTVSDSDVVEGGYGSGTVSGLVFEASILDISWASILVENFWFFSENFHKEGE